MRRQTVFMTGINILVVMLMSAIPLIDWACHLFGLLSGMLLGLWYFGAALGGPAFAHDAPSLISAQRAAVANARAIASGSALPAIPGAVVVGATATQQAHWQGAGAARSVNASAAAASAAAAGKGGCCRGSSSSSSSSSGSGSCTVAIDSATDCLCHPMTPINMSCGPNVPPALARGAMLAMLGLLGYFVLLAVGFGLIYGGFLAFPPPGWGTLSGDQIYVQCLFYKYGFQLQSFSCPAPYNNLP